MSVKRAIQRSVREQQTTKRKRQDKPCRSCKAPTPRRQYRRPLCERCLENER